MRGKPPGSTVRFYYDSDVEVMAEDVIESTGGSLYYVDEIERIGKGRLGRQRFHMRCVKLDPTTFQGEPDHHLYWYPRRRKRP